MLRCTAMARRGHSSHRGQAGKALWLLCRRQRPVYLLNYSVYKPPDSWKATHKSFLENSIISGVRPILQQVRSHPCLEAGAPSPERSTACRHSLP